jgi:hypothetical protein
MGSLEEARTGVLVLRAWVDGDGEHALLVRIIRATHGENAEAASRAAVTVEGVCEAVRGWLEELLQGLGPTPGPDRRRAT